jgi:DNA-directed RNA polymerase specialized sigma24 family protein
MAAPRDRWVLTRDAFQKFLAALDPNPERAGEIYEQTRCKLMTFFRCHGCSEGEALTDETLDRVTRRLGEIEIQNIMQFIRGVARNVAWEAHEKGRKTAALEEVSEPVWDRARAEEAPPAPDETHLRCLERCIKMLPPDEEKLIRDYYRHEKHEKIEQKRKLAEALGLSAGALRIKAFRIRGRLQKCVLSCVQMQGSSAAITKMDFDH